VTTGAHPATRRVIGRVTEGAAVTPDRRLMAVHAHPDDESSKGAASTARYVAEGVAVHVVTLTGGERGDVLNPALEGRIAPDDLPQVRRAEMAEAAAILGVSHEWLGFVDSGFPDGDPPPPLPDDSLAAQPIDEPVARLVAAIRRFRPQVVTTYDENGGYPHPDHIRCHEVTMAAVAAAAEADLHPDAGDAWRVDKVYYHVSGHPDRLRALHSATVEAGLESPFASDRFRSLLDGTVAYSGPEPTTFIECALYFEVRDDALRAHATQVDPTGRWFAVPLDVQRAAWPTEDFHLARSAVPASFPESDLFAGIDPASPKEQQ
jgi:mycothiol S-conjugate amidase